MAYTNFPDGITSFGIPVFGGSAGGIPLANTYWYVDSSTGSNSYEGTWTNPFATVAYAMSRASANDVIVVKAGHTESITSATTLVCNVAGVRVVGLGAGPARPTFTISTANTATIAVSAANVGWYNCRVVANFLSIASAFTLSTAAGFQLQGCVFRDTSSVLNFLNIVKSTGAANTIDNINVTGNNWNGLGTTSVNSFILSANDIANATVCWNRVKLARTVDASILMTISAGVLTNLDCGYNAVASAQTATSNGSLINVGGTTSNGFVYNNYAQTLTTTSDKLFTTTVGLSAFNNYVTGVIGASGFLIPAADS